MQYKKLLLGALVATALSVAPALSANAADAPNPLVSTGNFDYNGAAYRIAYTPVSTSPTVTRDYYRVASTYNVVVSQRADGKVVYRGTLGYTRAAYLHTKVNGLEATRTVSLDLQRDYGITTYIKKVTSFSVAYDRDRIDTLVSNYRESLLRSDVTATARNVRTYLYKNNDSLSGVQNDKTVVVKTDGFFGYTGDNVSVRLFVDPADSTAKTFEVVGLEKPDLYQSVHDSATGAVRSGPIDTVSNLD